MPTSDREHLDYQRRYYARPERVRSRMAPVRSRYVLRHMERLLDRLDLAPGARVVELGAGMGRFSLLLAERGYRVTAVDLSLELLDALRDEDLRRFGERRIETVCGDAAEVARLAPGPYDGALGLFFLHHLPSVGAVARGAAGVLRPGARAAFCEPNAWNPAFYAQVLFTPGMTWRGDGGIARMRPGVLRPAFESAGFTDVAIDRYGLFPPALGNRPAFARLEEGVERLRSLEPILAFQIVSGTYRGA